MTRTIAVLPLLALLLFACSSGPEEVDATVIDAGNLEKDSGVEVFADAAEDSGVEVDDTGSEVDDTGTGTTGRDASQVDGDLLDGEIGDGEIGDGEIGDGEIGDGEIGDGGIDGGPAQQLSEDFTDPENEIFTCPDTTAILPGPAVENGTQCLGIDGSGCPDARGLPGPGSVECADPAQNPFSGTGQCVADFFACFDPSGTCTNDGMGTFTWGNGATQTIQVDGQGALIRSEFTPSTGATPCIVGLPEVAGGTRVIYTQQ